MPLDETPAVDDPGHVGAHATLHALANEFEGTTPATFAPAAHGTHVTDEISEADHAAIDHDPLIAGHGVHVTDEIDATAHAAIDHTGIPGVGGGGGGATVVVKTADETVASSTTLQNDDHLILPVGAGEVWALRLGLMYDGASPGGGLKVDFAVPAGATGTHGPLGFTFTTGAAMGAVQCAAIGTPVAIGTAGTPFKFMAEWWAVIEVGGTAGNVTMRWAQNASNATATRIYKHSFLVASKV